MPQVPVSIIIVSYNGSAYLPACLESLSSQLGTGFELIVVDNASTDGTPALLERAYPWVRLVESARNLGFAAACNLGAARARGRILVFLNQDTQVLPGWLPNLLAPLEAGPGVGLVASKALLMSRPALINTCGLEIHFTGLSSARAFGRPASCCSQDGPLSVVSGSCFAVRADAWRRLGGFDESYFMYYEDADLSWRAELLGLSNHFAAGSRFLHKHTSRPGPAALYYSERNRWVTLLKNWRWVTLLLIAPSLFLVEIIQWLYCARFGAGALSARLRALAWVLLNIPAVLRARRAAQTARSTPDNLILGRRSWRLEPAQTSLGPLQRRLLALANAFFRLNYAACAAFLRAFDL